VNGKIAQDMAQRCQEATKKAWAELASSVREKLAPLFVSLCTNWDKRWPAQVDVYFQAHTSIFPLTLKEDENDEKLATLVNGSRTFREAFPDAEAICEMIRSVPVDNRPKYQQDHAGRWQYQVEMAMRSLAAHRSIRHVP